MNVAHLADSELLDGLAAMPSLELTLKNLHGPSAEPSPNSERKILVTPNG